MDEPAASMAGVVGQEDTTTVDLMPSSSVMEDSRALGINAVDGGCLEEEEHITQNTTLVTMGVETIGTISQASGSVENGVPDEDFNAGPSSAMDAPFVQAGYANSTMPQFNLLADPSAMAAPYIPGGYTSLLMEVDQDATLQTAVRKLHFDGVQE